MTTYNPVLPLTKWDRFADFCHAKFGASAPEVVTVMAAAFLLPVILGCVALAQL